MKNEIKILGTIYKVKEVDQIDKFNMTLGEINYISQEIYIDKSLNEDLKREVLIHEIFHGILEKLGYVEINEDEQKVQSIASTLYGVLKDNNLISF